MPFLSEFLLSLVMKIRIVYLLVLMIAITACHKRVRPQPRKPVIYLYPEKPSEIKVVLSFDGEVTATYPVTDDNSWSVKADPSGEITADGKKYHYLFWEGEAEMSELVNKNFENGFVVEGKNAVEFLETTLTKIGLNSKERNDFIVYWLPELNRNKYNFIYFLTNKEYDSFARLKVTPQPDQELRVFMIFKPLEEPVAIPEQEFKSFHREGFTLVDWGGCEIKSSLKIAAKAL